MISKYRKGVRVTTLVVTLAVMQAYVSVGFTATVSDGPSNQLASPVATVVDAAGITAVLTTSGNQAIMVNDTSTVTGATILNGDSIETPAAVAGMISIPGHGRLEITPNAKLTLGLTRRQSKSEFGQRLRSDVHEQGPPVSLQFE